MVEKPESASRPPQGTIGYIHRGGLAHLQVWRDDYEVLMDVRNWLNDIVFDQTQTVGMGAALAVVVEAWRYAKERNQLPDLQRLAEIARMSSRRRGRPPGSKNRTDY